MGDELRLLLDHFINIRVVFLIKYINSEYTQGYKDILLEHDKLTREEDIVCLKGPYNDRERTLKGFINFYEVKKGTKGSNTDFKAKPQSKILRKRYNNCSIYINFEQENESEDVAEEEVEAADD